MRYLVLLVFMVINTNGLLAQTEQRKYEVSPEVVISIEKENTDTLVKWRASLLYKQKEIELINEQVRYDRTKALSIYSQEVFNIPSIYKVLLDKDKLFMFIFIKRALWIYTFDLEGRELNRVKVMNLLPGSVENFGGVGFRVDSLDYKDVYYLLITQVRSSIMTKMLKLKKSDSSVTEIHFGDVDEVVRVCTVDSFGKMFYKQAKDKNTLNKLLVDNIDKEYFYVKMPSLKSKAYEEKNSDLRSRGLTKYNVFSNIENDSVELTEKKAYIHLKALLSPEITPPKLLRFIGPTYFFVEVTGKLSIVRYNENHSEWLFGDYQEKELDSRY